MEAYTSEMFPFFKSILDQDTSPVVVCDTAHQIRYINPAACVRYSRYGGEALIGRSLLDCHNESSKTMISRVLSWFQASSSNNRVHTLYQEKENKDVYMIALRDGQGTLIGYYEKHEYRERDRMPLYSFC